MTKAYPYTYLSFTCDGITLAEIERDHADVLAISDKSSESEAGCGLLIHICDVSEWWKQEDELLELLTEHYLSFFFLIDPTAHAVATLYVGGSDELICISPQLMAICTSLRIEILVNFVSELPEVPCDQTDL